jgi:hypothetical protein
MTFAHSPTVNLDTLRCFDCGRWWAKETARSGTCPYCAVARGDERYAELTAAHRTIAALKGALTKARRRTAGAA